MPKFVSSREIRIAIDVRDTRPQFTELPGFTLGCQDWVHNGVFESQDL